MPFKSKAQQGYLFAKKPAIAKKMASKTPAAAYAKLPEHVENDPYRAENRMDFGKKRKKKRMA